MIDSMRSPMEGFGSPFGDPRPVGKPVPPPGPFTTSAAGPWFEGAASLVAVGPSKFTVAVDFTVDAAAASNMALVYINNGAGVYQVQVYWYTSGRVAVNVKDDAGVTVFAKTGKNQFLKGVAYSAVFAVDLSDPANGKISVYKNGALVTGVTSLATTGKLSATLLPCFLRLTSGSAQYIGSIENLRCWAASPADGSIPAGSPLFNITGPAQVANAHILKRGADAV